MQNNKNKEALKPVTFGRRKVKPRACVVDRKPHVRTFLAETLEELGFVICDCARLRELEPVLDARLPDLIVLGLSGGADEAGEILRTLAANKFGGSVILFGARGALPVAAVRRLGERLGIAMLPTLTMPFGDNELRHSLATLLPVGLPPNSKVDVAEALDAGWLELWYQPKIDTRTLAMRGAEALIRLRHPTWGVVPPACFIAKAPDPHLDALSDFVIARAAHDWRQFEARHGHVEIAINLPIHFFRHPGSVGRLCRQMPDHPAFEGLIVETDGVDIAGDPNPAKDVARQLRFHRIAISIDDVGAEWPSLAGIADFPFVEIKVDRQLIAGCAYDGAKRAECRRIVQLADGYGARTVAEGVETEADFLAVRDMGFDLAQGFLFAKPMGVNKFVRTMLDGSAAAPS